MFLILYRVLNGLKRDFAADCVVVKRIINIVHKMNSVPLKTDIHVHNIYKSICYSLQFIFPLHYKGGLINDVRTILSVGFDNNYVLIRKSTLWANWRTTVLWILWSVLQSTWWLRAAFRLRQLFETCCTGYELRGPKYFACAE